MQGVQKKNDPAPGPGPDPTPTPPAPDPLAEKCSAKDYRIVEIGDQTWFGENYRCSKYDTESEAYKLGITSTADFVDAANTDNWGGDKEGMKSMTAGQINELGYLYSWGAAVGLQDVSGSHSFAKNPRQGICPNGWRVPSNLDYGDLVLFIENNQGKGSGTAAKHLKTTTGWKKEGYPEFSPGLDTYHFSLLPSGDVAGGKATNVGSYVSILTASDGDSEFDFRYTNPVLDALGVAMRSKSDFGALRCIKVKDGPEPVEETLTIKLMTNPYAYSYEGGNVGLNIYSNTSWTITNPDADFLYFDEMSGSGDKGVIITVQPNKSFTDKNFQIVVQTKGGKTQKAILRLDSAPSTVKDRQGNRYPVVFIGDQLWMAENLKCTEYDSESGVKVGDLNKPTAKDQYTASFIDAHDYEGSYTGNMYLNERAKVGYHYNWAAVCGVVDAVLIKNPFSEPRQGICPNGWVIPRRSDFANMVSYIEQTGNKGKDMAGYYLKSTSGWNTEVMGGDPYGFSALPAAIAVYPKSAEFMGTQTSFWTCDPTSAYNASAYRIISSNSKFESAEYDKNNYMSVRCIKKWN